MNKLGTKETTIMLGKRTRTKRVLSSPSAKLMPKTKAVSIHPLKYYGTTQYI
jgi:hypothetical protein